jgi:hypothetical protein
MPLTSKGTKILSNMAKTYGAKKAKTVLYAMIEEGKITGAEKPAKPSKRKPKK